ncbi:PASTA domain-containing protein [Herbidospora sp. RD11066]
MRFRRMAVAAVLALTAATPAPALAQVTAVEFWGWGLNDRGQIGDGGTADRRFPLLAGALPGERIIRQIVIGSTFGGGVDDSGAVFLWGALPGVVNSLVPVRVDGLPPVESISLGERHVLARAVDGTVWAWGDNTFRQLGDGTTTGRPTPQQVAGLTGVRMVSAGYRHSLAVTQSGQVWAWGHNGYAQLGDGTTVNRGFPVVLTGITGAVSASASRSGVFSLALKADGSVWSWGNNADGQLGVGGSAPRYVPTKVPGVDGATQVAAGEKSGYAIVARQVYAWGDNTSGRLGDGTTTTRRTPVVTPITDVQQVDPGMGGTAAALTTGFWAMTWGDNTGNALGRNAVTPFDPVAREVLTNTPFNSISIGHSTGLGTSNLLPDPPPNWARVPDLIGLPESGVRSRLTAASLRPGVRNTWVDRHCARLGRVVDQSPVAGTAVAIESEVDFTVAVPPAGPCP